MKYYIYAAYDNELNIFSQPFLNQFTPDTFKELQERYIKTKKYEKELDGKELYYLGEYEDKEATFKLDTKKRIAYYPIQERKELKKDEIQKSK